MKIGFFITARLKSTRLKRKILLDMNGKSVLDRVIERAKQVNGIDGIVLCTSTNQQDAELYENALKNQIEFYRGSEDDVLKRLLDAAKHYGYDAFVSITADNPLFSIHISNVLIEMYNKNKYDFISVKGLPMGCATYFLDVKALEIVDYIKQDSDTEIWGPFINRPDFFNIGALNVENHFDESIRLTLDYKEDYILIKKIYSCFPKNHIPDIFETNNLLLKNPDFLNININRKQTSVSSEKLKEINDNFNSKINEALIFAKKIEKKLTPSLKELNIKL